MVKGKTSVAPPPAKGNENSSNPKCSRDDLNGSDDEAQISLNDVMARMENLFRVTNNKIESCKRDLHMEISTLRQDVQQLKEECRAEINHLTTSIDAVRADVFQNADRLAHNEKANDLLISGVPYNPAEDLAGISKAIFLALGYTEKTVPLVYAIRLARFPIQANAAPPILMQFAFKLARDKLYRRYLTTRKLSSTHLGFNSNERIYINENLTKEALRIKNHAVKMKRNGKLFGVFTRNGCIFVKTAVDTEAVPVRSLNELPN